METVFFLTGGLWTVAIACFAWVLGRTSERNRKPAAAKPPDLRCGCHHELAYHDEEGRCHSTEGTGNRQVFNTSRTKAIGWERNECECRQYTGPRPIDSVFQPRISMPEGS